MNTQQTTNNQDVRGKAIDLELKKWVQWDYDTAAFIKTTKDRSWYEGTLDKLMDRYNLSGEDDNLGEQLADILKSQQSTPTMQEEKEGFTGGWTIEKIHAGIGIWETKNDKRQIIASVYGYAGNREQIASLIANAPDLLQLAKQVIAVCSNEANYPKGTGGHLLNERATEILNRINQ